MSAFHLSLPCLDVEETKAFYLDNIGASSGRQNENWIDINLFGNQITFTKAGKFDFNNPNYVFEGKILPSFHFGVIIDKQTWSKIYAKLTQNKELSVVAQALFLQDRPGEHSSFFIKDPNGYMLEFKTFSQTDSIFDN